MKFAQKSDRRNKLKLNLNRHKGEITKQRLSPLSTSRDIQVMHSLSPKPKKHLKISKLYQNLLKINISSDKTLKRELHIRESNNSGIQQTKPILDTFQQSQGNPDDCTIFFQLNSKKLKVKVDIQRSKWSFKQKVIYKIYQMFRKKYSKDIAIVQRLVGISANPINLQLDYFINLPEYKLSFLAGQSILVTPILRDAKLTKTVSIQDFLIIKCIGQGGFSKVFLVRSRINGQFYAMKLIQKKLVQQNKKHGIVQNQRNIMVNTKHPFVLKIFQFFQSIDFLVFVLQYCPGGQLYSIIRKIKRMTEQMAKFYFVQILIGIQYLHSQKVLYRDLKPQNILLDIDGHIRIADFGLAKPNIGQKQMSFSFCGSPQYMSPQMISKAGHSYPVDYYCLGAMLYQLVVGIPPFYSKNTKDIYKATLLQELTFPDKITMSYQLKSIIKSLMHKKPNQRLGSYRGIKQIWAHPWFSNIRKRDFINHSIRPPNQYRNYGNLNFQFKQVRHYDIEMKRQIGVQQRYQFKNIKQTMRYLYYDVYDGKYPKINYENQLDKRNQVFKNLSQNTPRQQRKLIKCPTKRQFGYSDM